MEEDKISDLPDSLIHEILSHLEMKDAIKTSVLSTRWKHLWTQTPVLNFVQCFTVVENFFRIVYSSLALHKCPKIHRFRLSIDYAGYKEFGGEDIYGMIQFAMSRKASELELDSVCNNPCVLNLSLLDMGSLEVLKLHYCTINLPPPAFKGFKHLKTLYLSSVSFDGVNVGELLACSPILEYLTVIDCRKDTRILISSSNRQLKHLSLQGEYELDICVPNLLSLDISMPIHRVKYSPESVSSLTNVSLDLGFHRQALDSFITRSEEGMIRKILEDVHHARVLKLNSRCIQVLSMWELEHLSAPISMHKCLVLESALGRWELPGIACLLRSSPNLESLVIKEYLEYPDLYLDQTFKAKHESDIKRYLESQFSCLLHHLKTIKISGFTSGKFVQKNCQNKIKLVEVLLKHAVVLEKMTIHITHKSNSCDKVNESRLLSKMARKVQAFRKASTRAEVLFLYDIHWY